MTFCLLAGCGSSKSGQTSSEATTESAMANVPEYKEVVIDHPEEYVKLGQYKGLTVDSISSEVTDQDVENDLESLAESYTEYPEVTDRKDVRKGDFINVDYVCVIDGKENELYSDTDIDIEIGENELLGEGFEDVKLDDQLVGHKVGDTIKVTYSFPKDYDDAEVAGKNCEQTITIKKISEKKVPEINDAFIQENTDYNTVDEYKKAKKTELEEAAKEEADQTAKENLWNAILENAEIIKDFPEDMTSQEKDNLIASQAETAEAYGVSVEELFSTYYGMNLEDAAVDNLKYECVIKLLQKELNIEVSDQEVADYVDELVKSEGYESKEALYEAGLTDESVVYSLTYDKISDALLAESKINIVEAPETEYGMEDLFTE